VVPNMNDGTAKLIGVSSYSIGCQSSIGGRRIPRVFGRINSALPWIKRITSQTNSCSTNKPTKPQPLPPTFSREPTSRLPTSPLSCKNCGYRNFFTSQEKIIGGEVADENEFPWAALLLIDHSERCGGSLINDRYILTAAHCFEQVKHKTNVDVDITLGEHDRDRRTNNEVYRTSRTYTLHPDYFYGRSKLIFDFALVKIDPVSFTDTISPICLPSPTQTTDIKGTGTAYGWGHERIKGLESIRRYKLNKGVAVQLSTVLQKIDLQFIAQSRCSDTFGRVGITLSSSHLCALSEVGDTCSGDSGGSLIRKNGGKYEVVGVISFGVGCNSTLAGEKIPGVYARVTEALDWIEKTVSDRSCN